jgi:hypothetical protein
MAKADRTAAMTAGLKKGEPNPAAGEEVRKANAEAQALADVGDSELTPLVETTEPVAPDVAATGPPTTDLAELFKQALSDPSVKQTLKDVLTSDPELRQVLGIEAGIGAAAGEWSPNYERVDNHVMGGLEVQHDPDFTPLPPAAIPVYVTDKRFLSHTKDTTPLKHLAQLGADGRPVKTEQYKLWIDLKMAGKLMTRNQLIDIEKQAEGAPQLSIDANGNPVTLDGAGGRVESLAHDEAL